MTDDDEILLQAGVVLTDEHLSRAHLSWYEAAVIDNNAWRYHYELWKKSGKPRGVGWWEEGGKYSKENFAKFLEGRK